MVSSASYPLSGAVSTWWYGVVFPRFWAVTPGPSRPDTFTASFTEGMSRGMSRALTSLTDAADGVLKRASDNVQSLIDRYDRDIEAKLDQLERYRAALALHPEPVPEDLPEELYSSAMIGVGGLGVTACRTDDLGEEGWDLHFPVDLRRRRRCGRDTVRDHGPHHPDPARDRQRRVRR